MEVELPKDFKDFLRLLNDEKVDYLLISLRDFKRNKKASGRHKDFDDLENLP